MRTEFLRKFFTTSPAVRLIRSPHAFWIVDFLTCAFKSAGRITRPHSELAVALDDYLDRLPSSAKLAEPGGQASSREKADTYLANWSSGSVGWLKRFIDDDSTEPSYQLTAEFEKALGFVEQASHELSFVGTESRLRSILETLENVVVGVTPDPELRLQQLKAKRDELALEIARVEAAPDATRLSPTQVRERFTLAIQQLAQLKSEFRAVEDRFKEITRSVQQRILSADQPRGDILQFALDSEDMLKQGDQGQSFFEFLKLIHAPDSQDRMAKLVGELAKIEALADGHDDLEALRGMVPTLIAEAEKILRTTQHLSLTLRKLLDSRSTRHHQQLTQVLRDILGAAARSADNPPTDVGLDVEVEIEIQCPVDRPFWAATEPFEEVSLLPFEASAGEQALALEQMAALERIDWPLLRRNVASLTETQGAVRLEHLLDRFPLQSGAVELLGYLQIAFDDGHLIDRSQVMTLPAETTGSLRRPVQLPSVIFLPKSDRRKQRQATQVEAV